MIKKEELDSLNPNRGLSNIPENEYIKLYSIYRKLFTEYIIGLLNLKKYDERIKNGRLGFLKNKKEDMDLYQYYSSDYLDYFYLRNNLYVEKLNEDELNFLNQKLKSQNYDLDDKSKAMVGDTYQKVIFEDALRNGEECTIFFGPSSAYMAKNNGLIIGMRYDEFNKNGLTDEKWDKLHTKQKKFLRDLRDEMNEKLSKKIDVPLYIFRYNDFSIRKRNKEKIKSEGEER